MTTPAIQNAALPLDLKVAMEAVRSEALAAIATAIGQVAATPLGLTDDLASLRNAIITILTVIDTLATKLNADAGVTDENYATNNVATHTPAAIITT